MRQRDSGQMLIFRILAPVVNSLYFRERSDQYDLVREQLDAVTWLRARVVRESKFGDVTLHSQWFKNLRGTVMQ